MENAEGRHGHGHGVDMMNHFGVRYLEALIAVLIGAGAPLKMSSSGLGWQQNWPTPRGSRARTSAFGPAGVMSICFFVNWGMSWPQSREHQPSGMELLRGWVVPTVRR